MRQLAAILFADMTGYTALMQKKEYLARISEVYFMIEHDYIFPLPDKKTTEGISENLCRLM